MIFYKFDYANWTEWDENEVAAIREYILADWTELVKSKRSLPYGQSIRNLRKICSH